MIAAKLGLDTTELVKWNKGRIKGLVQSSKLQEGTRVRIKASDADEVDMDPYCVLCIITIYGMYVIHDV